WALVAEALRRSGCDVLLPALDDGDDEAAAALPFWRRHVASVAAALDGEPERRPLILVGHSGAGALLPAIRRLAGRAVAAYLFVDAGIPNHGESRLGPSDSDDAWARELLPVLQAGGAFPTWSDADLRDLIPDDRSRARLLAELHPRGITFWTEAIPVFDGWPDAPCGFLHFSGPYDAAAKRARREGWPYRRLAGGHFHMLVDPDAVAAALIELAGAVGSLSAT
ncbi:MAG: alpha/beta fold hydrolase, partial [Dehalococcoidia bacterium]